MNEVFSKWWVSGVVMLPLYVICAFVCAKLFSDIRWLFSMLFGVWVIGEIYCQIVLNKIGCLKKFSSKILAIYLFGFQVVLVAGVIAYKVYT